ncbi:hypothetical protein [Nonomuraea sp. CA-141351]|uniref:hypothetical protein n=1 Tax=Nonomuraea sp. CA-141351 TaxID=3239996 RepID=UPI003D8EE978
MSPGSASACMRPGAPLTWLMVASLRRSGRVTIGPPAQVRGPGRTVPFVAAASHQSRRDNLHGDWLHPAADNQAGDA